MAKSEPSPRRDGSLGEVIGKIKARRRKIRKVENAQRKAAHVPRRQLAKAQHARKRGKG